jgi:TolB-like protein/DNA-binding winged helix-turn-helix (wHTH) protein
MPSLISNLYRFGEFALDPQARVLRRGKDPVALTPKAFDVLVMLVRNAGRIVTKDELMRTVWPDNFVEESNLSQTIFMVRKALDETSDRRYILTVQGQGYRFLVPVAEAANKPEIEEPEIPRYSESVPENQVQASHRWPIARRSARTALAATLSALILLIAVWAVRWRRTTAEPPERIMLAVLPFENLTGDPDQAYFSDGMTEEMITELGRLDPEHLGVIGRTSVMLYKQNPKSLDQIGRELGVQYVLEGSVQRDSSNVRITAQLIQVKDQTHVWARRYDRELNNLLALQAEIAQEVADEITLTLSARRATTVANRSTVPHVATSYEAYDLYLEGRYFWNERSEAGFKRAADYFQQAIAKDPSYAPAYAGLADTFGLMSTWFMASQNEFMPKARAAALKALELDETLAEAHASLALVAENYDYDWETAEKEFRRAIQLNPDYPTAHQWYAEHLAWQGRFAEAAAESERARRLDPMSIIIASDYARILYYSRQYDRAIAQSRAVGTMSGFSLGSGMDCFSHIEQGEFEEALTEIRSTENDPWTWAIRAYVYGRWHHEKERQDALARFEQLAPKLGFARTSESLLAYAGSNEDREKDKLLALLQEAYAQHSPALTNIKVDPKYDPLRRDSRFQELLHRISLTDEQHRTDK